VENTIPGILPVKCYIDHRPLAVKPFATSGVTQAFLVLCQGLTVLGSDAKKSQHLGFEQDCELDIDHALQNFELAKFWKLITCSNNLSVRRPVQIHNPTLGFMYFWIIVTLFPGTSVDDIGFKELQILYAMVNKIRFSPVKWLVPFWISSIAPSMPLCFTSLITRIAKSMGLLETNEVE